MIELSERLKKFNAGRLTEIVKLKYEAMTENIFRFYRGTCHLFYEDLHKDKSIPNSPLTWVCGDLHLENFGSYKADNKLVYFDLNDFDESIRAPALWEVLRIVASIFIAFIALDIDQDQASNLALLFIRSYSTTLKTGKAISIEPRTSKGIVRKFLVNAERNNDDAVLNKRTEKIKNKVVLSLKHERHFKIKKTLKKELNEHISNWIKTSSDGPYNYEVKDAVFRLAGTGSIGVKRYLFLLKSTNTPNKYLIVDMKQSMPSSLSPYVRCKQPEWDSDAHRIIFVQQYMQNMSASLLSATIFNGETYVIQELQPNKDTLKFKLIKDDYRDLYQVIDDMAILTASSQLRSSGVNGSATIDELKAFGMSVDEWHETVLNYSQNYCNTVRRDYKQFVRDYKRGLLTDDSNL
jgi:uncharacterized protein (DUF2252 family)